MTALSTWQNKEFEAPRQLTDILNVADNRRFSWTNLSGEEHPTDPHFTEGWSEADLTLDDPLIHGRHARAWARAGQRALDRKFNENDG